MKVTHHPPASISTGFSLEKSWPFPCLGPPLYLELLGGNFVV